MTERSKSTGPLARTAATLLLALAVIAPLSAAQAEEPRTNAQARAAERGFDLSLVCLPGLDSVEAIEAYWAEQQAGSLGAAFGMDNMAALIRTHCG